MGLLRIGYTEDRTSMLLVTHHSPLQSTSLREEHVLEGNVAFLQHAKVPCGPRQIQTFTILETCVS